MRNFLKLSWNPFAWMFLNQIDLIDKDLQRHEDAMSDCELNRIKLEYSFKSLKAQRRFLTEGTEESA